MFSLYLSLSLYRALSLARARSLSLALTHTHSLSHSHSLLDSAHTRDLLIKGTMYKVLKTIASTRDEDQPTGQNVVVPSGTEPKIYPEKMPIFDLERVANTPVIPMFDEDYATWQKEVKNFAVKQMFAYLTTFKLEDLNDDWESTDNASATLSTGGEADLKLLKLVDWTEMSTDFAIQRWCASSSPTNQVALVFALSLSLSLPLSL